MIISKTPFRISFAGGGSDLPAYYSTARGAVIAAAIKAFMYVTVNKRFDDSIRVSYSKTEIVTHIDELRHDLVREAMRAVGLQSGLEITTVADVPAGTGLGSSSSLTVGLLNALYAFAGKFRSPEQLASEACRIEIEVLQRPIGRQDQYTAAYGGMNHMQFNSDHTTFVDPVIISPETKQRLQDRLLMFFVGIRGENDALLAEQSRSTTESSEKRRTLGRMVELADQMRVALSAGDVGAFGELLHAGWEMKKQIHPRISAGAVDEAYDAAIGAGAHGGKLLGAGGAGFLLFCCPPERQEVLRRTLLRNGLREFGLRFEPQGSKIIYLED